MSGTGDTPPPWRPRPFSRPVSYLIAAAATLLALLAVGAMTLRVASGGPRDHPLAGDCALASCAAKVPRDVTGTAARSPAPARPRPAVQQPVLAPKSHPIRTESLTAPPSPQPTSSSHPGHSHRHWQQ